MDMKNAIACGGNLRAPRVVTSDLGRGRVSATIHLHHHFPLPTKEVCKVRPDGRLPDELESPESPITQLGPEFASAEIGCDRRMRDLFVRHG
jgi:hypothetical protein